MTEPLTVEDFSPHVGEVFAIVGREDQLTLAAAEPGRAPGGAVRQPFILFFRSPRERMLPEGLYEFESAGGRRFDLYVMPIITPPGAEQDYQVVFN